MKTKTKIKPAPPDRSKPKRRQVTCGLTDAEIEQIGELTDPSLAPATALATYVRRKLREEKIPCQPKSR